jgi:hypothetical protein
MQAKERKRGFYWVEWTNFADSELVQRRPGPLVGEWDGRYWWFARMQTYRFDSEVSIVADRLSPPADFSQERPAPGAEFDSAFGATLVPDLRP